MEMIVSSIHRHKSRNCVYTSRLERFRHKSENSFREERDGRKRQNYSTVLQNHRFIYMVNDSASNPD